MYSMEALKGLVHSFQLECDSVTSGEDAVSAVKQFMEKHHSTYQLIILDYKLPKWNGPFTTNLIRDFLS